MSSKIQRTEINRGHPSIQFDEGLGQHFFEVTAVIGRVDLSPNGTVDPVLAAFALIGEHRAPGRYSFPHEDGGRWVVNVEVEG
jgi:hypothetical protein